jgi:HAD superfamily hydrolase (TIGR01509 family)
VIRAVIFDCDGVLVDSEPISNRVLAELLTQEGLPMTAEESVEAFMGRSWKTVAAWAEAHGAPLPEGFRRRYLDAMFAVFEAELKPVPGVVAALDAISLPNCVASSASIEKMRFTLGHTGLWDRFEGRIFSATEVAHGKPAPDLFLHAAGSMGWEPADCAVVEDSPAGVEAGLSAGMTVFGYAGATPPSWLTQPTSSAGTGDALRVFTDMAELPGLLQSPS